MFNTLMLFSRMGFIWSLLKSRGFSLICKNVRLKSQEEVSETVNPIFFWQSSSLVAAVLAVCVGVKGVVLFKQLGCWQPLWALVVSELSAWISMAASGGGSRPLIRDFSSFFPILNLLFGREFPQPVSFGRWSAPVEQLRHREWKKALTTVCVCLMFRFNSQVLEVRTFLWTLLACCPSSDASLQFSTLSLHFMLFFWQQWNICSFSGLADHSIFLFSPSISIIME